MAAKPTRRKRKLGRYLERLRLRIEPAAPTPEQVAKIVETARTTITRMESGQQLPQLHLMYAILGVYQATNDEREEAAKLWRAAKQDTTVIEHAAELRPKYVIFRRDESEAVRERTINYVALTGLLQTPGYASAIADASRWPSTLADDGWEQRAAEERQARQRLLSGPAPLHLHAIISEACLLYQVGGPAVMAEQLRHLLTMARKPNVTIQVVPFSVGAFGPMTGPVIILEFDDDPENPHTGYLEHAGGAASIEEQTDVTPFVALFDDVQAVALSPTKSADVIRAVLDKIEDTS